MDAHGNLTGELTGFVGRRAELALVRQSLIAARLVTLTGPGASGKRGSRCGRRPRRGGRSVTGYSSRSWRGSGTRPCWPRKWRGHWGCPTRWHGIVFHPAAFPEIRHEPQVTASGARFVQTTGGRTGLPMPRPVSGNPHVQWVSPTVWTTLTLTIGADGSVTGEMTGASKFPRHWVYDHTGQLTAKSAVANLDEWMHVSHGVHTRYRC